MAEEAKEEEENGRGCREERKGFTVVLGGRLVASCGGADGGKTSDECHNLIFDLFILIILFTKKK